MTFRSVLVSIALFLLGGCAATGPQFTEHKPPKQEESRIYFYRPYSMVAQGGGPAITIDEKKVVTLLNKGYTVAYVPPGQHRIGAKGNIWNWAFKDLEISITTAPGSTHYVRIIPGYLGSSVVGDTVTTSFSQAFSVVENGIARKEISACLFMEPEN